MAITQTAYSLGKKSNYAVSVCRPESLGSMLHVVLSEHFIIKVTLCFPANEIDKYGSGSFIHSGRVKSFCSIKGNMFLTVMATDAPEQNLNESSSWSRSY